MSTDYKSQPSSFGMGTDAAVKALEKHVEPEESPPTFIDKPSSFGMGPDAAIAAMNEGVEARVKTWVQFTGTAPTTHLKVNGATTSGWATVGDVAGVVIKPDPATTIGKFPICSTVLDGAGKIQNRWKQALQEQLADGQSLDDPESLVLAAEKLFLAGKQNMQRLSRDRLTGTETSTVTPALEFFRAVNYEHQKDSVKSGAHQNL